MLAIAQWFSEHPPPGASEPPPHLPEADEACQRAQARPLVTVSASRVARRPAAREARRLEVDPLGRGQREEVDEGVAEGHRVEHLPRHAVVSVRVAGHPSVARTLPSSSSTILRTSAGVTGPPSTRRTLWWALPDLGARDLSGRGILHEIEDGDGPVPPSHAARYWSATVTLFRKPASVTVPPGTRTSSSARASATTSGRCRSSWCGRAPSRAANGSRATATRSGWATHVPSNPSVDSRSLSSRTRASATSVTWGSRRFGMKAAIPPIAWAPRR